MRNYRFERVDIRLSFEEKENLEKKAKKTGLTKSTLIRFLLDGYEPQTKVDDEFYIKLDELRKATDNLQNIARLGVLRGWDDMEIYNQTSKDISMLILDIKREFLLPEKMNNKRLKLLEKFNTPK
ncbi:MAG: hypothetical protein FWF46_02030 [Oscillospiraceae bacterium]|nr:hypothetical protein [Oscillospiraceae bacterium]